MAQSSLEDMRAVQFREFGGPEVLEVVDVEEPHAAAGQVRIRVEAVSVNPIDYKQRSGAFGGDLPGRPGRDASGVVDEVGEGVEDVAVGDAVFGFVAGGGTAEHLVLDHWARKPDGLSFEEAAGYPVAVETTERVLRLLDPQPGQTLIVNGAAGGVGTAAVQIALSHGLRVIGTASERNHEYLRELGAEPVTYGDELVERVSAIAPDGVDRAFDASGHGALPALIELTGTPDHVVTIADFSAGSLGVRVTSGGGEVRAYDALDEAARLHEDGRFTLPVAQAFPFEQAAEAHRASEGGHVRGKLVLTPR
jgi:NADPH:quinone reductase-like Zn-dependent oxidoreductase